MSLPMQSELRKLLPQPHFGGERTKWRDFVLEWELWWKHMPFRPELKALAFISCLPQDEQEICRSRLLKFGHDFQRLFEDLSRRYSVDDSLILRKQWHECRCTGENLAFFLKWHNQWTLLRERLSEVSESEARACFLAALPNRLQIIALKKEEQSPGKVTLAQLEAHVRTKIETEEKRLSLQGQISGAISTVSEKSAAPSSSLSDSLSPSQSQTNIQAVSDRSFQSVRPNRFSNRSATPNRGRSNSNSNSNSTLNSNSTHATRFQQRAPTPPRARHQHASPNTECFYCHAKGHFQMFCPKRRADRAAVRTKAQSDLKCNFCHHLGHDEAHCFAKNRQQRQRFGLQPQSAAPTNRRFSA